MATVTIKGFLKAWSFDSTPDGAVSWGFSEWDAQHENILATIPYSFTVEVPELNVTALKVAALEEQKKVALAEYQKRVAALNEQLSKLQCLEAA